MIASFKKASALYENQHLDTVNYPDCFSTGIFLQNRSLRQA